MKFRRIISILVLVCFFTTQVVIKPKEAEAAIPAIAGVIIDAVVSMAISAGVTYAIQGIESHIAANEVSKNMSEYEIRRIKQEGGLTEVTVDEFLKKGYKVKKTPKKIFRMKGPFKAGLIGAVLSLGLSGGEYLINYISEVRSDNVPDILNEFIEYYPKRNTLQPGESKEFTIINPCSQENGGMPKTYFFEVPQGHTLYVKVSAYQYGWKTASYTVGDLDNAIRVDIYNDGETRLRITKMPSGESKGIVIYTVKRDYINHDHSIHVVVTNETDIEGYYDVTGPGYGEMYKYEGTIATEDIVIDNSPEYINNRQRLEDVKEEEDKVVYIIQYPEGNVDIETGTEIADEVEVPDPSDNSPVEPSDPTEGDKPDLNKLYGVVTTRWPFSLPWDIAHLINLVACEPIPPRWEFVLPEEFGEHTLEIDMAQYEDIMIIVRWFITFGFCFGIVLAIRKLYGGSV